MTETLNEVQRTASQLAVDLRSAEARLVEATFAHSSARTRLPKLMQAGDRAKCAQCKQEIEASAALMAEITEECEFLREAAKEADKAELEAASVRSYELIRRQVTKAAEATVFLEQLVAQFGTAITEWNSAVADANNALMKNGISPLRDHLAVGAILNLIDMNLYASTNGVIGKIRAYDSIEQLRESITTGGHASLTAAAEAYKSLTLRHARIYLGLSQPELTKHEAA